MQGKVLVLDQVVEAPELALRLSEIEMGVYALVAITPYYMWHPRVAAALNAWGPRRVLIDVAALEAGAQESLSSGLAALSHARELFPGAKFHMLASPVTVQSVDASALARDGVPSFSGPLLPPTVALTGSQLRAEHDLLDVLRAAMAGQGSTAIVVAPSRGRAAALARRLGSLAIAYHGGLSASEQLAALEAFRAGRARALVATEAVTTIDLLPAPSTIVFAHPPRTLDTLFRASPGLSGPRRRCR
jgi:superfamily II DNA helicase RecQ